MDSKYNVLIIELAESDIEEILVYISDNLKNPEAAKKIWFHIQEGIDHV